MTTEISLLIASSQSAYDIAKSLSSTDSVIERNHLILKLLEVLINVQTQALSVSAISLQLKEENLQLTMKITELENWAQTISNYELKEMFPGILAHCRKGSDNNEDLEVWICPYCYNKKQESFLKYREGHSYSCPQCKATFKERMHGNPSVTFYE